MQNLQYDVRLNRWYRTIFIESYFIMPWRWWSWDVISEHGNQLQVAGNVGVDKCRGRSLFDYKPEIRFEPAVGCWWDRYLEDHLLSDITPLYCSAREMLKLSKSARPKLFGPSATNPWLDGILGTTADRTTTPLILATTVSFCSNKNIKKNY